MGVFLVDRIRIAWLTALAAALAFLVAAKNGSLAKVSYATAHASAGAQLPLQQESSKVMATSERSSRKFVEYDAAKGSYAIVGSGENMWSANDDSNLHGRK